MEGVPILVVEDEYLLQSMIEEALTDAGFGISTVGNGEEAIALLKDSKAAYRALVADINGIGKINGWEVAKAAREIDPEFPVVYVTAAAADWGANGVPNSVLIAKPFAPAQLVTAISNLLNAGTPPTT